MATTPFNNGILAQHHAFQHPREGGNSIQNMGTINRQRDKRGMPNGGMVLNTTSHNPYQEVVEGGAPGAEVTKPTVLILSRTC